MGECDDSGLVVQLSHQCISPAATPALEWAVYGREGVREREKERQRWIEKDERERGRFSTTLFCTIGVRPVPTSYAPVMPVSH